MIIIVIKYFVIITFHVTQTEQPKFSKQKSNPQNLKTFNRNPEGFNGYIELIGSREQRLIQR